MITMGSPDFVWIIANEIISSWYLLGAVFVPPPPPPCRIASAGSCPLFAAAKLTGPWTGVGSIANFSGGERSRGRVCH
jgi:hypothetical protein